MLTSLQFRPGDWREDSIKTRIETWEHAGYRSRSKTIEEKIPLKQGLKQISFSIVHIKLRIEEKIPLKQGLKPKCWVEEAQTISIEEKIPLKQGLKLKTVPAGRGWKDIEEKIPLKQGLKPDINENMNNGFALKRRFH